MVPHFEGINVTSTMRHPLVAADLPFRKAPLVGAARQEAPEASIPSAVIGPWTREGVEFDRGSGEY